MGADSDATGHAPVIATWTLRARVLIDATGRATHLARWVGARRIVFDRLVGVATLFGEIDTSREGYILVETTPDGWWYSAPVLGTR